MGITTSPFQNFYGEKLKIIGSSSDFGRICYITKQTKSKKKITDKNSKSIMVGYAYNHTKGYVQVLQP